MKLPVLLFFVNSLVFFFFFYFSRSFVFPYIFKFSISNFSLLVYTHTNWLCISTLCPTMLLDSITNSGGFWEISRHFLYTSSCYVQIEMFYFYFANLYAISFFLLPITLAVITVLDRHKEGSGHPCFVSYLGGKAF